MKVVCRCDEHSQSVNPEGDYPPKVEWVSSNQLNALRAKTSFSDKKEFYLKTTEVESNLVEFPACWPTLQISDLLSPTSHKAVP